MKYYVVDAFTNKLFKGNPAGVCILEKEISDDIMQSIALENNFSETAFVLPHGNSYKLRWFTPTFEIDLCGHATLASAFIILNYIEPDLKKVKFETMSGTLEVTKKEERYEMIFPKRIMKPVKLTSEIIDVLGIVPKEVYCERDLFVVLDDESQVRDFVPDYTKMKNLTDYLGIVLTAKGKDADFVSRCFCPEIEAEDPVTGSTHCSLIPFWSLRLNKSKMIAKQLSKRGGILYCELTEECVKISGEAVLYLKGEIVL